MYAEVMKAHKFKTCLTMIENAPSPQRHKHTFMKPLLLLNAQQLPTLTL